MKKKIKVGIHEKIETKKLKVLVSIIAAEWWIEEGIVAFRKWLRKNINKYVEVK